jgi:hypothetical protein
MNEKESSLVISIAKIVMTDLQKDYPGWQRAFIRFDATDDYYGFKGSYQTNEGVWLFDPFKHDEMFRNLNQLGVELRDILQKDQKRFCVFLLTVESDFSYTIDFEYENAGRWAISKMNGASGLPIGIQ